MSALAATQSGYAAQSSFFGDEVMLNPQPLPPRVTQFSYGDEVTINPQPLPPRVLTLPPEYFAVQE